MNGRELSAIVGVSESTVSRLLSGDRGPSIETMARIQTALGWPLGEQWVALAAGVYPSRLTEKMEGRGVRAATAASRAA